MAWAIGRRVLIIILAAWITRNAATRFPQFALTDIFYLLVLHLVGYTKRRWLFRCLGTHLRLWLLIVTAHRLLYRCLLSPGVQCHFFSCPCMLLLIILLEEHILSHIVHRCFKYDLSLLDLLKVLNRRWILRTSRGWYYSYRGWWTSDTASHGANHGRGALFHRLDRQQLAWELRLGRDRWLASFSANQDPLLAWWQQNCAILCAGWRIDRLTTSL